MKLASIITTIKKKIASRKERKAVLNRIRLENGKVVIDAYTETKIISQSRMAHDKLLRRKNRRAIWGQKFDGESTLSQHQ